MFAKCHKATFLPSSESIYGDLTSAATVATDSQLLCPAKTLGAQDSNADVDPAQRRLRDGVRNACAG
jgi:hypothetical protein